MAEKLVLIVVDAMHPGMLRQAMEAGEAPTFAALAERGELIEDMVSSFPSVTPVCCSEMMTGAGPGDHGVIGMNWYHRLERRYIEYGSSFEATRTFGLFRAMYDLVYNMNLDHLSWEVETLFERLGDAGVRTATTPFLIYRGRKRHKLSLEGLVRMAAAAANFRHAVWAPDEFFYGDLYASRPTGCTSTLGRPGTRDQYSACVGEELVREGAYDFLLFALPDNDFHSHRHGPEAQPESIAKADVNFARIVEAAGGMDDFLD
ncbi:MAG: alkaline phosphatase family protein, partial [Solirubrobacterales bacterium]